MNPNPVLALRSFLGSLITGGNIASLMTGMLAAFLLISVVSNKALCGWGCQLGLLQGALHRVRLPKWQPSPWLTGTIRAGVFAGLVAGLTAGMLDIIGVIDPFRIFSLDLTIWVGMISAVILAGSLFVYRPWCRFICPFGFVSWLGEQVSLMRPRINREKCSGCRRCIKACPGGAMEHLYADRLLHADCFACGACIRVCPRTGALGWRIPAAARTKRQPEAKFSSRLKPSFDLGGRSKNNDRRST
jgi:polyferredoxin